MNQSMKLMLGLGVGCLVFGSVFCGAALAVSPDLREDLGAETWKELWRQREQIDSEDDAWMVEEIAEESVDLFASSDALEQNLAQWEREWNEKWDSQKEVYGYRKLEEGESFARVEELELELNHWDVEVLASDEVEQVTIAEYQANGQAELQVKKEDEELKIYDAATAYVDIKALLKNVKEGKSIPESEEPRGRLVIYIPTGSPYEKLELNLGQGSFLGEDLRFDELDVTALGNIEIKNSSVRELDAEWIGDFSYQGSIEEEGDLECIKSTATFLLEGKKEDFRYEFSCVGGSVTLNQEKHSGAIFEIKEGRDGKKELKLDGIASDVRIDFE